MGVKIRAHRLACCLFLPQCHQGTAQDLEVFPDAQWEPLHFSAVNPGTGTCPHRATRGVMMGTGTQSCLCSDQGRVCLFPKNSPCPHAIFGRLGSRRPQRVAQGSAGGPDGCVLGRKLPRRGGAASKGRTLRSSNPRRKPSVFSRS